MADNIAVTPGTGKTVATDEVVDGTLGTVQVQYVKLMDGTLDGTTKATVNSTGLKVDASGAAVPITDNSGSLTVDNAGTFSTQDSQYVTEDASAATNPVGPPLVAVRRDTLSTSEVSADGDYIALKATSKGKLHTAAELRNGDTAITFGAGAVDSNTLRVTVDTDQLGSDPTKAEDVASAGGDFGIPAMAVQKATPANTAGTDGDYEMLQMSAGRLWGSTQAYGDVAHDAADSGNPVKLGAKATTSLSGLTLVADADRTNLFAGVDGVLITRPHCNLEAIVSGNATNTDGSSTACISAQAAGIKTYLTSVVLCNSHASTDCTVDIKDGNTVKISLPVPHASGVVFNCPVPIPGTAATAWNFDPSAAVTTITCSMIGFKSKV